MDNFRRKNVRWAASGTLHEKTLQWISIQRWMRHSACEESLSATAPALIIATCVYFSQPTLCNCESDLLWNAAVSLRPADTRSCRLSTAGWNLLDSLKNCSWYDMFLLSVISRDQLLIFNISSCILVQGMNGCKDGDASKRTYHLSLTWRPFDWRHKGLLGRQLGLSWMACLDVGYMEANCSRNLYVKAANTFSIQQC